MKNSLAFTVLGLSLGLTLLVACRKQSDEPDTLAEFEQREAADLIATWKTNHDVINTGTDCMMLRKPRTIAGGVLQQVKTICEVEYPRAVLTATLAELSDVVHAPSGQDNVAMHDIDKTMLEIKCFDILLSDAYKSANARSPVDPSVQGLFEQYAAICPTQAAKVKQKLSTKH